MAVLRECFKATRGPAHYMLALSRRDGRSSPWSGLAVEVRPMKTTVKPAGSQFKKKVLARWRWLARQGTSLEQAALEIGVAVTELRAWSQGESSAMPLIARRVQGEAVHGAAFHHHQVGGPGGTAHADLDAHQFLARLCDMIDHRWQVLPYRSGPMGQVSVCARVATGT